MKDKKSKPTKECWKDKVVRCRCAVFMSTLLTAILAAAFSASLAILLAEAVLQRIAPAGEFGDWMPLAIAAIFVAVGLPLILKRGFGCGSVRGCTITIPSVLVGVIAIIIFWLLLAWLRFGHAPPPKPPLSVPSALRHAFFGRGWVWLWGAVISLGIAMAVWRAFLTTLLYRFGERLRQMKHLGVELDPIVSPQSPKDRTDNAGTDDLTLDHWINGNEQPLGLGDHSLFRTEPSPQRVIASLRPTHEFGGARTLALVGQRGAGKSSLLRLSEGSAEAKAKIGLRFAYVSLWEHSSPQAALRAMADGALKAVKDRVDIYPFNEAGDALLNAVTGDGRFQWLRRTVGLGNSSDQTLGALSTLLLYNKLRVIICVEDDDRLGEGDRAQQFRDVVTGALDVIQRFPGFGYVICISSMPSLELHVRADQTLASECGRKLDLEELVKYASGNAQPNSDKYCKICLDEVRRWHHVADTAQAQQLKGLDVARVCREELVIPPMHPDQWKPLLEQLRERLLEQLREKLRDQLKEKLPKQSRKETSHSAETDLAKDLIQQCGAKDPTSPNTNNDHQQLSWELFLKAVESPDTGANWTDPAFGIRFTPRTLRRGLADAWRKWNAVIALQKSELTIHPDSLLVACLVRACRPDIWNVLLRSEDLLKGGDWPQQTFSLINPNGVYQTHKLPDLTDIPHLGLHVDIRNMMTKKFTLNPNVAAQQPISASAATLSTSPTSFQRSGGLIGKLDSEDDPGKNWRIFLNA